LRPNVRDALQALGESIDAGIAALSAADVAGLAPSAVGEGARRSMRHRLERLERRYVAGVKRANVTAMQDIATLRGWLFPHGVRQERALNFIPTLARHGPSAIDALTQRVDEHVATMLLGTTAGVGSISSAK
jgi:Bacillithiol biosynthesis BshC